MLHAVQQGVFMSAVLVSGVRLGSKDFELFQTA